MSETQLVISSNQNSADYFIDDIGGKGQKLLDLDNLIQKPGQYFEVPNFFILHSALDDPRERSVLNAIGTLSYPLAVRSSSPMEDGVNASFAGIYHSELGVRNLEEFVRAFDAVKFSAHEMKAKNHADSLSLDYFSTLMPVIVQEQVTDHLMRATVQVSGLSSRTSVTSTFISADGEKDKYDLCHDAVSGLRSMTIGKNNSRGRDSFSESNYIDLAMAAVKLREDMNFDGTVQVEGFVKHGHLPIIVQIRELPKVSKVEQFSGILDPREYRDVPHALIDRCNGVPWDISLPAYVTFSQAGVLYHIDDFNFRGSSERATRFCEQSKLPRNADYLHAIKLKESERFLNRDTERDFETMWVRGNAQFSKYVLVCDKLDESYYEMHQATSNKRAIITCLEDDNTSHAMTVSRELGIPCGAYVTKHADMLREFFHQVETGDIVRFRSDGEKGVVYIAEKANKSL